MMKLYIYSWFPFTRKVRWNEGRPCDWPSSNVNLENVPVVTCKRWHLVKSVEPLLQDAQGKKCFFPWTSDTQILVVCKCNALIQKKNWFNLIKKKTLIKNLLAMQITVWMCQVLSVYLNNWSDSLGSFWGFSNKKHTLEMLEFKNPEFKGKNPPVNSIRPIGQVLLEFKSFKIKMYLSQTCRQVEVFLPWCK